MRLITSFLLVAAFACLTVYAAKEYEHLKDVPFSVVKNQPAQRLVVFYFGSDEAATPVLDVCEQVAEYLSSVDLPKLKTFQYAKVDCEAEENKSDCDEAGFKSPGIWIFTSTPHEGIQSYSGARDTPSLANHIRHKFLPSDEADVIPFESETALFERMDKSERDPPKPIIVKFWESWCTHCKQLKLPYDQAAGFFKDQVEFMEVECSKNEATKAFCSGQGIKSYPTLILFDGENKHTWDMPDKSITSFQNFFLSKLPEDRYTKVEDKEAASLPPPPGTVLNKEEKARPAAGSSNAGAKKEERKAASKAKSEDAADDKPKKKASKNRDDDEDDAPRKRKKRSRRSDDDDEDDDEPRRRRRRSRRRRYDDDEDEDDEPRRRRSRRSRRRDDDDEEDEEPRKKSKKSSKKRKDEDDEEEEKPKKKKDAGKKDKKEKEPVHDEL